MTEAATPIHPYIYIYIYMMATSSDARRSQSAGRTRLPMPTSPPSTPSHRYLNTSSSRSVDGRRRSGSGSSSTGRGWSGPDGSGGGGTPVIRNGKGSTRSSRGAATTTTPHDRRRQRAQNLYRTTSGEEGEDSLLNGGNSLIDAYESSDAQPLGVAGRHHNKQQNSSSDRQKQSRQNMRQLKQKMERQQQQPKRGPMIGCTDAVLTQYKIEKNSASVQKIREGCVAPAFGAIRESVAFIKRARSGELSTSRSADVDGRSVGSSKSSPTRASTKSGSSGGGSSRDRKGRTASSSGRPRRLSADTRQAASVLGEEEEGEEEDNNDRGADDSFLGGNSAGGSVGNGSSTERRAKATLRKSGNALSRSETLDDIIGSNVHDESFTYSEEDVVDFEKGGEAKSRKSEQSLRDLSTEGIDSDVAASIQRKMEAERNWIRMNGPPEQQQQQQQQQQQSLSKGVDVTAIDGSHDDVPRASPKGVDSPYKREQEDALRQRAERQVAAIRFDGNIVDGEFDALNESSIPLQESFAVETDASGIIQNPPNLRSGAFANINVNEREVDDDETSAMRSMRLALFQGDDASQPSQIRSIPKKEGGTVIMRNAEDEEMVPVSRLKRAMGELIIQDDVIDRLQVDLNEVQADRDELRKEINLLREAASARAANTVNEPNKHSGDLHDELERERQEKADLQSELKRAYANYDVHQETMNRMMEEMKKLKADLDDAREELKRNDLHRKHQDHLRERSTARHQRQEEEIANLKTDLANANSARSVGQDPDGVERDPVEELQYRAEMVELKLQLSEAESKALDAKARLIDEQTRSKHDVDDLMLELDLMRSTLEEERVSKSTLEKELKMSHQTMEILKKTREKQVLSSDASTADSETLQNLRDELDDERNARKVAEGMLEEAHMTEKSLRAAKDILTQRLEKELERSKQMSSRVAAARSLNTSGPVDIDDYDDDIRRKDEEIANIRSELKTLVASIPDLHREVEKTKKESKEKLNNSISLQEDLTTEIESREQEIKKLRMEIQRLEENALSEMNKQLLDVRKDADLKLEDAKKRLDEALADVEKERGLRLDAETIIADLRADLEESQEVTSMRRQVTADVLQAEVDELKGLLAEAEEGLKLSEDQFFEVQEEKEALQLLLDEANDQAQLVEREINESVEQDLSLRAEIDSLQALLEETEREGKEARDALEQQLAATKRALLQHQSNEAARSICSSEREETLENELLQMTKQFTEAANTRSEREQELLAMRKQFSSMENILMDAKKQHEQEWSQQLAEIDGLKAENVSLEKELGGLQQQMKLAQEQINKESALSVKNVSLQSESNSLKSQIAELGSQLTTLETELTEKLEVEATLREAVDILTRRCESFRQRIPGSRSDPDDMLDDEMNDLNELLVAVRSDTGISGSLDAVDEGFNQKLAEIKRDLERKLRVSEAARIDAEDRLAAALVSNRTEKRVMKDTMANAEANSTSEKAALEKRLEAHVKTSEYLREQIVSIKDELKRAGIHVQASTKPKVKFRSTEESEVKDLMRRSAEATAGYEEEISELKELLHRVVRESSSSNEGRYESNELNVLSNRKLREASADLKRLVRTRDEMKVLQELVASKCEEVLAIHEANKSLKSGDFVAPPDELVGSVDKVAGR